MEIHMSIVTGTVANMLPHYAANTAYFVDGKGNKGGLSREVSFTLLMGWLPHAFHKYGRDHNTSVMNTRIIDAK